MNCCQDPGPGRDELEARGVGEKKDYGRRGSRVKTMKGLRPFVASFRERLSAVRMFTFCLLFCKCLFHSLRALLFHKKVSTLHFLFTKHNDGV